jgi:RNA polymerase sigma factor (sigma-70 family)
MSTLARYVGWPPPEELGALVRRAQQGDDHARDDLLTRLRSPFLAYFSYRVPSDLAEDLTQVALLRIAGAIPRIVAQRAHPYISAVARNLLRTAYQRRARDARRYAADGRIEAAESGLALDLDLEYRELAQAIEQTAATLAPPLARVVLGLLRGETTAEIAAAQGVSPITIRTRLIRARAVLRRELRVYMEPLGTGQPRDLTEDEALALPPERWRRCRRDRSGQ